MKLCKEANSSINDDTRLQYLKDGLKPSLRFEVLLKNPSSPEEFLEYAQKFEQLNSLENRQSFNAPQVNQQQQQQQQPNYHDEHRINNNIIKYNNSAQQMKPITRSTNQYYQQTPAQPYKCYKRGAHDHFIRNYPSFH